MRVRFRTIGGLAAFPGLATPRTIDVDALEADDRRALEQMIHDANFFALPARLPVRAGAADYQSYEIMVEDAGRQHTILAADPVTDPTLQALIARLRELTRPRR